jgi:glycosyltransferase involved in cell wall biosynthesis
MDLDEGSIEILPNPVDADHLLPRPHEEVPGRIVFVGTVTEKKGIRQLAHAMVRVRREVPEAHLVVAGPDSIDPETKGSYIERIRSELPGEILDRIEFLGRIPNELVPKVLAEASVAAYPSHMEALPLAWLEGLALGKAIVASRTGPGPEVIEHETSGLLCDPYDPADIAASIIRLLTDEVLRRKLAEGARLAAEERFALAKVLPLNEAFYERVLRAARP